MKEEELDRLVLAYLQKKGYKQAEASFKNDSRVQGLEDMAAAAQLDIDTSVANHILFYNQADRDPNRYTTSYGKLRDWVYNSLDQYKASNFIYCTELAKILYPVFLHCFFELVHKEHPDEARSFLSRYRKDHERLHERELQVVQGLSTPQHLKENSLVQTFRNNKIDVKLHQASCLVFYSVELLLTFLHGLDSMLLLSIINERLNIKVLAGQPTAVSADEDEAGTVTGQTQDAVAALNQKEILWGALEDSLEQRAEALAAADKAEAAAAEAAEKDAADGKDAAKPAKRAKKEKGEGGAAKAKKGEVAAATPSSTIHCVTPNLPLPKLNERVELDILNDLRKRISLSAQALPSVCFYTFVNAQDSLNAVTISGNGALVAGGFTDSSVKVWDMDSRAESAAPGESPVMGMKHKKVSESGYTLLCGHSEPVFGIDMSLDQRFLLSSSSDHTVRLWSLELDANLVSYRGHNLPVWDVQFSPVGHYFATASHDRTARLWVTDRIHPLRIFAGHLSDVDCVQWHVNCNYVATGSADKTVRLFDVQSGECVRLFAGHHGTVYSLAMSPDGRSMASAGEDKTVKLWDLGSGKCISTMCAHTSTVWSLAYSGEGNLLASGGADSSVRLWDVSSANTIPTTVPAPTPSVSADSTQPKKSRLLKTLPTRATPVYKLKFTRRNLLLAAGVFKPPMHRKDLL
eukprot:jgi/Chlat1/5118/Chrsp33S05025